MDGFKLNSVADVYVGGTLAKYVYVGNTKVWDYKTPPVYTAPEVITGLTYTGSPQELITAGTTSHGTFKYSTDGGTTWSTEIPKSTNANADIKVRWKIEGDSRHYDEGPVQLTCSIGKSSGSGSVTISNWVYGNTVATPTPSSSTNPTTGVTYTWYNSSKTALSAQPTSTSNVGTYYVRATFPANSNYSSYTTGYVSFSITARPIKVTAGSKSKTYDGSALTYNSATAEATGSSRGLVSGHSMTSCTVTGTITNAGTANNVPSAAVIKSGSTNVTSNYNITYINGTLTVNKADPTVTAPTKKTNLVYTGSAQVLITAGSTTGGSLYYRLGNDNSTKTTNASAIKATNAGTYYVWYGVDGDNNYNNVEATAISVVISKATAHTAPVANNTTFTGSPINLLKNGSANGKGTLEYSTNGSTWTTTVPQQTNAGTYSTSWRFTPTDTTNYVTVASTTLSTTISTKAIVIPTPDSVARAYNGNNATATFPAATGASITKYRYSTNNSTWTESTTNPAQKNVGTLYTQAYYTAATNYHGSGWSETATIVISRATALTGTVNSPSVTFSTSSQTTSISVSGASGTVTYPTTITVKNSSNTTVTGWSCTSAGVLTIPANTAAGSYTVTGTVSVAQSTNYNSGSASKTWTITINSRSIVVDTPDSVNKVYNGNASTASFASATGASITKYRYSTNGTSWTESSTNPSQTNKGTLYTQAYYTAATNYTGSKWSDTATITITARPIKVTASSASKTYDGTALTSNSATAEATGTNRGLVSGHSMTSCTVTGTITNPGTANNVPSAAVIKNGNTVVTSNYNITYVNGELTVTKSTPSVALSVTNRQYNGSPLYATAMVTQPTNGVAAKGTIYYGTSSGATTYSVAYSGTEVNLSSVSVTNVGSATVYAYFVPDSTCNSYYNNSGNASKTFQVTKAGGSVKISGRTVTYNRSTQEMVSVSGNTGTMHYRVGTNGTWSTTIPRRTNAGSDSIYWYMDASTNYNGLGSASSPMPNVVGTVNKATPVLSTSPTYRTGLTYTGSAQNLLTGGAMKHSSSDATAVAGTFTYDQGTNAGSYSSKKWYFTPTDTTDYNSTSGTVSGSTSIAKISVHTAPVANNATYSGSAISLLKNGSANSKGTLEYSTNGTSGWTTTVPTQTNAGSYDTWWRFTPTDTTNHNTISATKITTTIAQANGSIGISGKSLIYTGSAQSLVTVAGASGAVYYRLGENGTWVSNIPTATSVGTYTIYYYVAANNNYKAYGSSSSPYSVTSYIKTNFKPSDADALVTSDSKYFVTNN